MSVQVVDIKGKFDLFQDQHVYRVIARMNDYYFKLVRMQREFIWHKHPETDEVFMVIEGDLTIELRDQTLRLGAGQMVVIPKGVEHKPSSRAECKIMLIEPVATVNTGDAGGELTDADLEWI